MRLADPKDIPSSDNELSIKGTSVLLTLQPSVTAESNGHLAAVQDGLGQLLLPMTV